MERKKPKTSFFINSAFRPPPASGRWIGLYVQYQTRNPFEIDLNFNHSGTIEGSGSDNVGIYDIFGSWKNGNNLSFTKSYRSAHVVYYSGKFDDNNHTKIRGKWSFGHGIFPNDNAFEMSYHNVV